MDPVTIGALGGAVGNVGGSLLGGLFGNGAKKKQEKALKAALADIQGTNAQADPTAFEGVEADPSLVAAQRSVLQRLMQEGNRQGLGLEDRVALNEAQNQVGQRERGAREAILQNYAARGMGGSGAELASALTNQQGAADRSAGFGANAAASARQRQLAALAQSGEMAGQQRAQGFGEQATKASASDAVSRFNAGQRLQKAGMMAGARTGQANLYGQRAQETQNTFAGLGDAAGSVAGFAYGGGFKKPKVP